MTYEEAVKDIADELINNRNGAYGLAVRMAATSGVPADKLMASAVEYNKERPSQEGGAPVLVDVDFPDAQTLEAELLVQAEQAGGLGPDTLVLVPLLVQMMLAERERFFAMLGR